MNDRVKDFLESPETQDALAAQDVVKLQQLVEAQDFMVQMDFYKFIVSIGKDTYMPYIKTLGYIPQFFFRMSDIPSIDIPDNITKIGYGAFLTCNEIESIEVPESVKQIGPTAFNGCKKLKSLTVPKKFEKLSRWKDGLDLNKVKVTYI